MSHRSSPLLRHSVVYSHPVLIPQWEPLHTAKVKATPGTRGRYHGGRRPSSDDSLHCPTVIPPWAFDKPFSLSNRHSTIGIRQTVFTAQPSFHHRHSTNHFHCPTVIPPSAFDKPFLQSNRHSTIGIRQTRRVV